MKYFFILFLSFPSIVFSQPKSQVPSWLANRKVCDVIYYVHEKLWGKEPSEKVREVFARQPLYNTYDPVNGYTIIDSLPQGVVILKDFKFEVIAIKEYMGQTTDHIKMLRNMLDNLPSPKYPSALYSQLINGEQSKTLAQVGVILESDGSNIVAASWKFPGHQREIDWGFIGKDRAAEFASALAETIGVKMPNELQKKGSANENQIIRYIDPNLPGQVKVSAIYYRPSDIENFANEERFKAFKALADEYKIRLVVFPQSRI